MRHTKNRMYRTSSMKPWMMKITLAAVFGLLALPLSAATVSLFQPSQTVAQGDDFTLELRLNTTGEPPGNHGGVVKVTFDPSFVTYGGFVFDDPPNQFEAPIVDADSVVIAYFNAIADPLFNGVIGTFTFTADNLTEEDTPAVIDVGPGNPFTQSFYVTPSSGDPNIGYSIPAEGFAPAEVSIVPIPAAVWLMLSGLGVLGGIARRRS